MKDHEQLIEQAILGHASTREAMRWLIKQVQPWKSRYYAVEQSNPFITACNPEQVKCNLRIDFDETGKICNVKFFD